MPMRVDKSHLEVERVAEEEREAEGRSKAAGEDRRVEGGINAAGEKHRAEGWSKATREERRAEGQSKERSKNLDTPRRGVAAYPFFVNENRDRIREENYGIKFGEIGKVFLDKRKELTKEEKKPYEYKASGWYEYERLFTERPRGLNEKSAWLQELEKQHGQAWYIHFFEWYTNKLCHPKPEWYRDNLDDIFSTIHWASPQKSWHPTDSFLKRLTYHLSHAPISTAPDLYVGRYNGYSIGVVFNGFALDPPQVGIKTFKSLGVQYAHLPIFAGLRIKESKDDLCLLVLGNMYASTSKYPSDDAVWSDTRFVLALDATHGSKEFLIVYKYEVYSIDYLDDGSEKRSEELEHEKPPQFCDGPDAFTVAVCEIGTGLLSKSDIKDELHVTPEEPPGLPDMKLVVRSVKKPELVVAGYVDDEHPYVPAFPLGEIEV